MVEWPYCPDCGKKAKFLNNSASLYGGKNHGPLYVCRDCDTRVGCHKGTKKPLGTMAGKKIRAARQRAHNAFDPIWNDKCWPKGVKAPMKRIPAYEWLAGRMEIADIHDCHIGSFDVELCDLVVAVSKKYLENKERRNRKKARREAKWKK